MVRVEKTTNKPYTNRRHETTKKTLNYYYMVTDSKTLQAKETARQVQKKFGAVSPHPPESLEEKAATHLYKAFQNKDRLAKMKKRKNQKDGDR